MGALAYARAGTDGVGPLTLVIRFGFLAATDLIHWTWGRKLTKVGVNRGATDSKEET